MALDLEEEFRPIIVDSIVLTAINRPFFSLDDFEVGQPWKREDDDLDEPHSSNPAPAERGQNAEPVRPIYLKEAARKRFISLYESRVNEQIYYRSANEQTSYRRIFELQAYAMSRVILGESGQYAPFTVR